MKSIYSIIVTSLLVTIVSSCAIDYCEDVNCPNNSYCFDGSCYCDKYYYGDSCQNYIGFKLSFVSGPDGNTSKLPMRVGDSNLREIKSSSEVIDDTRNIKFEILNVPNNVGYYASSVANGISTPYFNEYLLVGSSSLKITFNSSEAAAVGDHKITIRATTEDGHSEDIYLTLHLFQ